MQGTAEEGTFGCWNDRCSQGDEIGTRGDKTAEKAFAVAVSSEMMEFAVTQNMQCGNFIAVASGACTVNFGKGGDLQVQLFHFGDSLWFVVLKGLWRCSIRQLSLTDTIAEQPVNRWLVCSNEGVGWSVLVGREACKGRRINALLKLETVQVYIQTWQQSRSERQATVFWRQLEPLGLALLAGGEDPPKAIGRSSAVSAKDEFCCTSADLFVTVILLDIEEQIEFGHCTVS